MPDLRAVFKVGPWRGKQPDWHVEAATSFHDSTDPTAGISVYRASDQRHIELIALAMSCNRDNKQPFYYVLISDEIISRFELTVRETPGDVPLSYVSALHRDIYGITQEIAETLALEIGCTGLQCIKAQQLQAIATLPDEWPEILQNEWTKLPRWLQQPER